MQTDGSASRKPRARWWPAWPDLLAVWSALLVGCVFSLPWPPDPRLLGAGAVVGAVLSILGLVATGRARGPLPRKSPPRRVGALLTALGLGGGLGCLLLAVLHQIARFEPALRARFADRLDEPAWRPWALAVEASILEEIVFRLVLLSGVAWFIRWLAPRRSEATMLPFWSGLVVSTLAFSIVHLPAWFALAPPSVVLVGTVIVLNGVAAVLSGWLFWRWGLPYAIAAHFAGDVVIQTLGPVLLS